LLTRYDHQIRLLRRVKWYVLPLYLWMLLVVVSVPAHFRARQVTAFVAVTAIALFVVWLNEGYGYPKAPRGTQEGRIADGGGRPQKWAFLMLGAAALPHAQCAGELRFGCL